MKLVIDLAPLVAACQLDLEHRVWLYPGVKEHVVRECLSIGMTSYYQSLNRLLDTELALQLDPHTTGVLRRKRDRRQRSRSLRSA